MGRGFRELCGRGASAHPEFFVHVDTRPFLHLLEPAGHLNRVGGQIGRRVHACRRVVPGDGALWLADRRAPRLTLHLVYVLDRRLLFLP